MSRSHQARGAIGGLKRTGASSDRIEAAYAELKYATASDYIRSVVDELPPLTEVQRARLAALLLGAHRDEAVPAA